MKREDAEQFAKQRNAENPHRTRRAIVVQILKSGEPLDNFNVQFRLPLDEKPTIDGDYSFVVAK